VKVRPPAGSLAASLLIRGIPGSLRNKALVSGLYTDCRESATRLDDFPLFLFVFVARIGTTAASVIIIRARAYWIVGEAEVR